MSESKLTTSEKISLERSTNLNSELLFFKNDVLGDIKQVETKLSKIIIKETDDTEKKLIQFQNRLDSLTQKLFNLSNSYSDNALNKEKLEALYQFRSKMEDTLNNFEYRLSSTAKDLVDAINKYDRIVNNNIYYQGVVGTSNARFRNLHDFIDYTLTNISQLNIFKDKIVGIDFKQYKAKLDSMIEGLNKQIKEIISNNKIFTIHYVDDLEQKMKSIYNLQEQRIFDLKIRNTQECNDLLKLTERLIREWDKIGTIKNEIDITFEKYSENFKHNFMSTDNKINQCIKDYNEMKKKFDLLIEFMKGVKSGVGGGFGPNMTFNEFVNYKENTPLHKMKKTAVSYLKKYIVGEMGMDQLTHLSRKQHKRINNLENNQYNVNNNPKSSKFIRKNTINNISHFNFNNNYNSCNNDINNNKVNQQQNFLSKSISQELLNNNNLKVSVNSADDKVINKLEIKKSSFERVNALKFNNKKNVEDIGKNEINYNNILKDKIFNNNIMPLNKTINLNLQKTKFILDNQNNNIKSKNEDIKDIEITNKSNLNGKKLLDFDSINEVVEEKIEINIDDNEEEKKQRLKGRNKDKVKFLNQTTFNNLNHIEENENEHLLSEGEEKKEKKIGNNIILVESHTNDINYNSQIPENQKNTKDETKNNNINENKLEEYKKNSNNSFKESTNFNNKDDYNIIVENEEKENEKDEKEERLKIKKEEKDNKEVINDYKAKEEKKDKYEIPKECLKISNFQDKENDTNINNFERYNDSINNISRTNYDKNTFFDIISSKNTIYDEKEKNDNYINNTKDKEPNLINPKDKMNLHKLLRGDPKAIGSITIVNNKGEGIKLARDKNNSLTSKKRKDDDGIINLSINKDQIKSNSGINFYPSSNPINKDNLEYFEDVFQNNNMQENNDLNYNINYDINNYSKKENKMNNTEFRTITSNRNQRNSQKLHIVNLPGIIDTRKKRNNFQKQIYGYNEAYNQILELRKINYDNDLYRKNKGPIKYDNSRNNKLFNEDKLRLNSYNGIINNNNGSF